MAELPFNIVIKIFGMVCPAICFESCLKRVIENSYEASEGLRTLQMHVLFYDLAFYFVIVQVAVI